jgi:hypothetical protein
MNGGKWYEGRNLRYMGKNSGIVWRKKTVLHTVVNNTKQIAKKTLAETCNRIETIDLYASVAAIRLFWCDIKINQNAGNTRMIVFRNVDVAVIT